MTNQQGAPNALRSIARYTIGYVTDDWGMRSSTPGGIQDPAGAWVRYEDHLAALVEAQQPAHAQAGAVPLTQAKVVEAFCALPHQVQFITAFDQGVRFAELHHGIKGGQHGTE